MFFFIFLFISLHRDLKLLFSFIFVVQDKLYKNVYIEILYCENSFLSIFY